MKRIAIVGIGSFIAVIAAWQGALALQQTVVPKIVAPKPASPSVVAPAPKPAAPSSSETPMAQRVATLGLLNKRNGLYRDLTMKPGEAVRIGDVVVRLKACETTQSFEPEQLTGAFVQVIVRGGDDKWRKAFSGWLYKESPSLNVVEHPIYDVWTKACTMRHPDTGPDTIVLRGGSGDGAASGGKSRPKAKKSASPAAPEAEPAAQSADDNNDI
jgi:hypothetical protein